MFLSFSIGKIIQKRFRVLESHLLLSIPIGFFAIQIIFFFMYGIFIVFNVDMIFLYWVSNATYIGIFLFVIAMSSDWLPHYSSIDHKRLIGTIFGIGLITALLFFHNHLGNLEWFGREAPLEITTALEELREGTGEAIYSVEGINLYYTKFQTLSYWTVSTGMQGGFTISEINNYLLPTMQIIILTSVGISILRFNNIRYATAWSPIIIMPLIILNGVTTNGSESFLLPTIAFTFMMVYFITNSANPNRTLGYIAIGSSCFLFFSHETGLYFFIILSGLITYVSAKHKASPTFQLNGSLISLSIMITSMIYTTANFGSIFAILISLSFLIPLNIAIVSKNSTRISSIDEILLESRKNIAILLVTSIFLTSIITSIINPEDFVPSLYEFYSGNPISFIGDERADNIITGALYLSSILIPLMFTFIFKDTTSKTSLYMFCIVFILFNPFTMSSLGGTLDITNTFGLIVLISTIPLCFSIMSVVISQKKYFERRN